MGARNGWAETISAFAVGIAVGTALGVLFAPKSGEETRDEITDNAKDSLDQAVSKGREWAQRAGKAVDEKASEVSEQVRGAADAGAKAYRETKSAAS